MYQIKTTFAHPEQCRMGRDEETGRDVLSRVHNHPTRPARPWEVNTWWADATAAEAARASADGGAVRLVPTVTLVRAARGETYGFGELCETEGTT